MIHLDTHVVAWLYAELAERLLPTALRRRLATEPLAISPMVRVELALLHETGRVRDTPAMVIGELTRSLDLEIDDSPFAAVAEAAADVTFTRDPFDRVITAQATIAGAPLATKDRAIRRHFAGAVWE